MRAVLPYLCAVLLGYLLGCSNMALYLGKLRKVDFRSGGSGNLGASNAMVLMGWGAGVLVAVHDVGKSVLAVYLIWRLFPGVPYVRVLAGAAAVVGHVYPFYLKFKGGKGFAAYYGMVLALNWKYALGLAIAVLILTLVTDFIVIGTMTTVASFPLFAWYTRGWIVLLIVLTASAVVIWKHRENFERLRNGTEVGLRKANKGELRVK